MKHTRRRPRRLCSCGAVHAAGAQCPQRNARRIHDTAEYQRARQLVWQRDRYRCHFCGKPTVDRHRKLRPTAAHWPLSIDELLERKLNPADPSTMVTAHASCHGRVDAERQHAS